MMRCEVGDHDFNSDEIGAVMLEDIVSCEDCAEVEE